MDLPLPGDHFGNRIVVASLWLNDDYKSDFPDATFNLLGLLMLINPAPPYFLVTQIIDGEEGWILCDTNATHWNIVGATAAYVNEGGDWP
jgi:hypothetical protein